MFHKTFHDSSSPPSNQSQPISLIHPFNVDDFDLFSSSEPQAPKEEAVKERRLKKSLQRLYIKFRGPWPKKLHYAKDGFVHLKIALKRIRRVLVNFGLRRYVRRRVLVGNRESSDVGVVTDTVVASIRPRSWQHPFAYGDACTDVMCSFIGRVSDAQFGMWQMNLWTVDATGLELQPDRIHLNMLSYKLWIVGPHVVFQKEAAKRIVCQWRYTKVSQVMVKLIRICVGDLRRWSKSK
ncbi:hypothetical protein Tco_0616220 [Tanacetum coccineum]